MTMEDRANLANLLLLREQAMNSEAFHNTMHPAHEAAKQAFVDITGQIMKAQGLDPDGHDLGTAQGLIDKDRLTELGADNARDLLQAAEIHEQLVKDGHPLAEAAGEVIKQTLEANADEATRAQQIQDQHTADMAKAEEAAQARLAKRAELESQMEAVRQDPHMPIPEKILRETQLMNEWTES